MRLARYISASWCKRCHELRPTVITTCQLLGISLQIENYDDLDEDESKQITSLPTLMYREAETDNWNIYPAKDIEGWCTKMMASPLTADLDF
jgi:hypothetical protein